MIRRFRKGDKVLFEHVPGDYAKLKGRWGIITSWEGPTIRIQWGPGQKVLAEWRDHICLHSLYENWLVPYDESPFAQDLRKYLEAELG